MYCTHETADLNIREKLAFTSPEQYAYAYREFKSQYPSAEAVFLSTCNRVEIYVAGEDPENVPSSQELARFFSEIHQVPLDDLLDTLTDEPDVRAVQHLFRVASSLDSMVLGEAQIVNQVKTAYETAQENNATGPLLHSLFQRALSVAGKVRTDTKLSEGRISIASVAVGEFAGSIFNTFSDKQVVVIGAGEMAEETLLYLKDKGVQNLHVVNRTEANAKKIVDSWHGNVQIHHLEQLDDVLVKADIVVSTLGTDKPFLDVDRMKPIRKASDERTLFLLDLGAPRNITSDVGQLDDNIFLYNINDLEQTCQRNRKARSVEAEKATGIVIQAVETFQHEIYHRTTGPIVKRLREHWHDISRQELERLTNKLDHLETKDRDEIERTIERIVNKLLHPPLEEIRSQSKQGTPHSLLETVKKLFHLHD